MTRENGEIIMKMREMEDVIAFKRLGFNLAIIGAVAVALIIISMYLS